MNVRTYTIIAWLGIFQATLPMEVVHFEPVELEPINQGEPPRETVPIVRHEPPMHGLIESEHAGIKPSTHRDRPIDQTPLKTVHSEDPHQPVIKKPVLPQQKGHDGGTVTLVHHPNPNTSLPSSDSLTELFPHVSVQELHGLKSYFRATMQEAAADGTLSTIPLSVSVNAVELLKPGIPSSLISWVMAMTDGFAFVGKVAPANALLYDQSKAVLASSVQTVVGMIGALHANYGALVAEGASFNVLSSTQQAVLSDQVSQLQATIDAVTEQRNALIAHLQANSPSFNEALAAPAINPDPGVQQWKLEQGISKKNAQSVFPSYKAFLNGFPATSSVKAYVETFIGTGRGKFATVQALVTALDTVGFVVDSQNIWLSLFHKTYSKKAVDAIIDSILQEYPGTIVPSRTFILSYCIQNHSFKKVDYFIPRYQQFLIDAQTLTIEELAQKYGQGSDLIKSLLTNVYEAAYVTQQMQQVKPPEELIELMAKISMLYPERVPDPVMEAIALQDVQIRYLFNAEMAYVKTALQLRDELVELQVQQLETTLRNASNELDQAQSLLQKVEGRANLAVATALTDNLPVQDSEISKQVVEMVDQLAQVQATLDATSKITAQAPSTAPFVAIETEGTAVAQKLVRAQQGLEAFGLQLEENAARAHCGKAAAELMEKIQSTPSSALVGNLQLSALWDSVFGQKQPAQDAFDAWLKEALDRDTTFDEVGQVIAKSALARENESDYEACIWASNKIGVMETRINLLLALLKVRRTPVLITWSKQALKTLQADYLFLSSQKVHKCLNVIASRKPLLDKIDALTSAIKNAEKEEGDEQPQQPAADAS